MRPVTDLDAYRRARAAKREAENPAPAEQATPAARRRMLIDVALESGYNLQGIIDRLRERGELP